MNSTLGSVVPLAMFFQGRLLFKQANMGSGRTLLTFIVFALALTTTSALSECFESGLVPGVGCDPTPNICEIACPSEGNCELVGDGCTDDTEISEAEMTKDKCQDMCQASNSTVEDNHCRFWRWVSFISCKFIMMFFISGSTKQQ